MFKILLALLLLTQPSWATQWRAGTGELSLLGSSNASDIDTNTYNSIVKPLDNLLATYNQQYLNYTSAGTLTVSAGSVTVSNSDGSIRLMLINTTTTTIDFTNIDTGAEASNTTYYVYAIAATTSSTAATYKISASSSSPSGSTYWYKIGSFLNNASSNIENITNNKYGYISSPASNGTSFSANVVYQNTNTGKLLVAWTGAGTRSGGWVEVNQQGVIGETSSPATVVAGQDFSVSGSSYIDVTSGSFVVPPGWYWEITNAAGQADGGSLTGTISRIETWNLN